MSNSDPTGCLFSRRDIQVAEVSVKTLRGIRNVLGIAGLLLGGYIVARSVPDIVRYVRISTM